MKTTLVYNVALFVDWKNQNFSRANLQHLLIVVGRGPGVASLEGVHSYVWKRTLIGDIVKKDVQFHRFKKQWNDDEWNIFAGAHVVREAVWVAWVEEGARIWEAGWVWDCAMGGG